MPIIKIDNNNPYKEYLYDILENFLELGNTYLPFIFMKKFSIDNISFKLPKYITQREWDCCSNKIKKLAKTINWK